MSQGLHELDCSNLKFNNQFLISEKQIAELSSWNLVEVGGYFLYIHPNLEFAAKEESDCHLISLGYWYDYRNPEHTNQDIVNNLKIDGDLQELLDQLQFMSGIYLVLLKTKQELLLFTDLCALREAFINTSIPDKIVVASSPNILRYIRVVEENKENDFYKSDLFKSRMVWVSNETPYQNITRLKPNHYLNLYNGEIKRYFPIQKLQQREIEHIVEDASKVLPGILKAALHRKERLMVGLTAGWDSRLLLASSKAVSQYLLFFVNIYTYASKFDHLIPSRLAAKLNLNFLTAQIANSDKFALSRPEALDYLPYALESEFKRSIYSNILFDGYKTINGSISEIARNEFGLIKKISGKKIAALAKFTDSEYCIAIYDQWLKNNQQLFESFNYAVLDMFYWEEVLPNRVGKKMSENHAVNRYTFSAFNCRYLITTLLTADKKFRSKQHNILYSKIIESLWKEVLDEPVNPIFKKQVIRFMQKIGVYDLYRSVFTTGLLNFKKKKNKP